MNRSSMVFTTSVNNNKITNVPMGTPFKPVTMTQGSFLTNAKAVYVHAVHDSSNEVEKQKPIVFNDASDVIAKKRRIAVGKNTTRETVKNGEPSSNASANQNTVNSALSKVRGGGAVVPPKVGLAV